MKKTDTHTHIQYIYTHTPTVQAATWTKWYTAHSLNTGIKYGQVENSSCWDAYRQLIPKVTCTDG